ncbi:conserved hypothetical protein [gamma proteobacterium HTCC5015]|nr:conserved hypothetical protein [gamma proteobacterium HTCC5015]
MIKKRFGLTVITQPPLTQYLGPWILPAQSKRAKQLSREKDLMQALVDQLPQYHIYRQTWSPDYQNWMPFYWRGFAQTTRYSYRIENLSNLDEVWGGFQAGIRSDIRKAQKQGVVVERSADLSTFLSLNEMVFKRQGRAAPHPESLVKNIDEAAASRNQRAIFIAADEEGRSHAAVYLVWDQHSAYYLMGGGDPELRNSGATSLCLWEAIQFAATVTRSFDFEGSMIEPVERFFRAFGGEPVPFYSLSRAHNRWLNLAMSIRS